MATASVPILDNKVVAADKVLNLTLTSPSAGALAVGRNTATLTLKDDDTGRNDRLRQLTSSWLRRKRARGW